MSIINDALKKAQENLARKESTMSTPPDQQPPAENTGNTNPPQNTEANSPSPQDNFVKDNLKFIAQQRAKEKQAEQVKLSKTVEEEHSKPPKDSTTTKKQLHPVVAFFACLICTVIILGAVYFALDQFGISPLKQLKYTLNPAIRKAKQTIHQIQSTQNVQTITLTPAPEAKPVPVLHPEKEKPGQKYAQLVLTGIVTMNDRRVALINNEIYEIGDFVDGRKIVTIAIDKVELQDENGIITLPVKGK